MLLRLSGDSLITMVSSPLISLMQWVIHAGWIGVWPLTDSSFLRQSSRSAFQLSASNVAALVDSYLCFGFMLGHRFVQHPQSFSGGAG